MKNSNIADAYANNWGEIKTANMFIEGKTIYSYGYHFPIAYKLDNKEVLFNENGYSNTTARHKGLVKRALISAGYKLIFCKTEVLKNAINNNTTSKEEIILNAI